MLDDFFSSLFQFLSTKVFFFYLQFIKFLSYMTFFLEFFLKFYVG